MNKRLTPKEFVKIARQTAGDEKVPYAFEKRVMANLFELPARDVLGFWARGLWRAVAPCIGVVIVAGAVAHFRAIESPTDLDADLERAVLAPLEADADLAA